MERRQKKRNQRCATEPPLTLVCSKNTKTSDQQITSPDLLNISWTWDNRVRRTKTLKRRPTVAASFKRRATFRKTKKKSSLSKLNRKSPQSKCSSDVSSEYFDAPMDKSEKSLENDWTVDFENFADALDDINQVYLYEERRLDFISQNYSYLYNTTNNSRLGDTESNSRSSVQSCVQSTSAEGDGTDLSTSIKQMRPPLQQDRQKSRPTSYIDMIAKTIKWTLRKSNHLFPRSRRKSLDSSNISIRAVREMKVEAEFDYKTLPHFTLPCQRGGNNSNHDNDVNNSKIKNILEKLVNRNVCDRWNHKRKPKQCSPLQESESFNFIKPAYDSVFSMPNEYLNNSKSTTKRRDSAIDSLNCRKSKCNGWMKKYKKSTSSSTMWEYSDPKWTDILSSPHLNPESKLSKECDINTTSSPRCSPVSTKSPECDVCEETGSRGSPSVSEEHLTFSAPEAQVRDKVELYDIRSLTDSSQKPINITHTNLTSQIILTQSSDYINENLVRSIEDTIIVNNNNNTKLKIPGNRKSLPSSPLLKRFLSTISESALVSTRFRF